MKSVLEAANSAHECELLKSLDYAIDDHRSRQEMALSLSKRDRHLELFPGTAALPRVLLLQRKN